MPADPAAQIVIDVVSDVVCPWCYVGKRRLEGALRERPGVPVAVRWHPFQLDPAIPGGGVDRTRYLLDKFGRTARIDEIHTRLEEAGQAEGIAFAFGRIARAVNTLDAHRLIRWAAETGRGSAVTEALMRGYFVEGLDIGDPAVLAGLAATCGMDEGAVAAKLAGDAGREDVRAAIAAAARMGVFVVPCFIFAGHFAVVGAQSAAVLAKALDRARQGDALA